MASAISRSSKFCSKNSKSDCQTRRTFCQTSAATSSRLSATHFPKFLTCLLITNYILCYCPLSTEAIRLQINKVADKSADKRSSKDFSIEDSMREAEPEMLLVDPWNLQYETGSRQMYSPEVLPANGDSYEYFWLNNDAQPGNEAASLPSDGVIALGKHILGKYGLRKRQLGTMGTNNVRLDNNNRWVRF